ncbi:F-box-like/WD repeat-containing protein TBL1XR1 isoform X1 [Histomonas meleagridis]|uniref:F-box-like/WD repeat-containing protein TBL1XR1 isoform X1 n=1 Tax=Histomonas meleagridis TaxID=135588 RepID=UPI00355A7881|nr:F-box-like/WD repeat-containing protein TBL1XR1 isoform X1 [Histomonas meleagridis]KAH0796276.1 F-box-like/WD repeat-containing protein TBL1XR1 isoform X1 [Histomonas meleagridis]
MISSDEINFLIRRYLQETGFPHTAYIFSNEALVDRVSYPVSQLPPQALVTILKKGMLYMQLEKSINEKAKLDQSPENIVSSLIEAVRNEEPIVPPKTPPKPRTQPTPPTPPTPRQPLKQPVPIIVEPTIIQDSSILTLRGHFSDVYCGSWNKDGTLFASGGNDATAIIWEIRDHTYKTHYILDHATQQNRDGKDITTLSWNPSGTILATACLDGVARLWTNHGELKFVLNLHHQAIFTMEFSPDGTSLLTGSSDQSVIVWNVLNGDVKQFFQHHRSRVLDVDWRDNSIFASCDGNATILICKLGEARPLYLLYGHTSEVNKIEWDPSRNLLASCADDRTIRIWSPFNSNSQPIVLTGHTNNVYTIQWAPNNNGKILASGAFDNTVRLWNIENKTCVAVFRGYTQPVYTVCFSPLGKYLVSGGVDGLINVIRTSDFALVARYAAGSSIYEAKWDPTGENIALCLENASIVVIAAKDIPYYQE